MRFVAILVVVAFVLGLLWPHLHKFRLAQPPGATGAVKGKGRFDRFFAAFVVTLIVTIVISTVLLWFHH